MSLSAASASATKEELLEQVEKLAQRTTEQDVQIAELAAKVAWFEGQVLLANHRKFGASSEKLSVEQEILDLFNEAEGLTDATAPEPTLETITYRRRKQKGHRDAQLEGLPTEVVEYRLPEDDSACPRCAGPLHVIGKETTKRKLKIVPAMVSIVEYVQFKYACRCCEKNEIEATIVAAPLPADAFPNSLASPSLVAYVMSQKFMEALPLYRQEQAFARDGIEISRQTLANWMIAGAGWLRVIYDRLKFHLLAGNDIVHADETTLQVLHEAGRAAQTKSYIWLYRSGRDRPSSRGPIVLYEYQATRSAEHPQRFLKGYQGYLHTDGYDGYANLPNIINVGCWAHARRYFKDALDALPKEARAAAWKPGKLALAAQGLLYCNALFDIERALHDVTPAERHAARLEKSRLILDKFEPWLTKAAEAILPKSPTAKAIRYCQNQWPKLTTFLQDGRLELDNNLSERSIRPFVIGRKNWLFANTPDGAASSATIYSIVMTAKENGLHPFAYLTYLFEQLPAIRMSEHAKLDALLPWSDSLPASCRVPAKPSAT